MENNFNNGFSDIPFTGLSGNALINSGTLDMLYDRTKKMMWGMVEFKELQMLYSCAIKEMSTKLDVLNTEFNVKYKRNPISSVQTRLKRTESIIKKLSALGYSPTLENTERYINDFAGVRVICSYIDDIYAIADALLKQDDIKLVERKDYIAKPKSNGYRSLHLIVTVPVFFADKKREMKVEVQIRTIAMDFWASLEHQMKYKREIPDQDEISEELKKCAETIAATDVRMQELRQRIERGEDAPTEEEQLLERLAKLDIPI